MTEPQVQHRPWNLGPALWEWGPLGQLPFIQGAQFETADLLIP